VGVMYMLKLHQPGRRRRFTARATGPYKLESRSSRWAAKARFGRPALRRKWKVWALRGLWCGGPFCRELLTVKSYDVDGRNGKIYESMVEGPEHPRARDAGVVRGADQRRSRGLGLQTSSCRRKRPAL